MWLKTYSLSIAPWAENSRYPEIIHNFVNKTQKFYKK